jgi:hypothetical protein
MRKRSNLQSKARRATVRRGLEAAVAAVLLLTACSAVELEDRCFPMMAAVDYRAGQVEFSYGFPELSQKENTDVEEAREDAAIADGEDFAESYGAYEQELSRTVDCNHMKVLVLGENFLQTEQYDAMLTYLQETEIFPRNTYVCTTDDTRALYEIEGDLPEDLGTYLESYLQKQGEERGITLPDLGDLLDARINGSGLVELPYLTVEDGAIIWP